MRDLDGPGGGAGRVETVRGREVVVVDRAEIAVRPVGKDGRDHGPGMDTGGPCRDQRDRPGAPAATDETPAREASTGVRGLGRADPVHLVEGLVRHIARMDAAAEAAHQAGPRGLAEDGGAGGVHTDQAQPRPVPAQRPHHPGTVTARADTAHQYVQVVELGGEFGGERRVPGDVVRVVVLVGPVRVRQHREQLPQPGQPRRLPAAHGRRTVDEFEADPVRAQQLPHGRLQFAVADQHDGMAEGLPGEGETDPERPRGGLHHRCAWPQFTPLPGAEQHGHGGPRLHATGAEPFELGPETGLGARQIGGHPGQRCAAEECEEIGVGGEGRQRGRRHSAASVRPSRSPDRWPDRCPCRYPSRYP